MKHPVLESIGVFRSVCAALCVSCRGRKKNNVKSGLKFIANMQNYITFMFKEELLKYQ